MKICIITLAIIYYHQCFAQDANAYKEILTLENIRSNIQLHSSHLSMYNAQVQSLDEAAKGVTSWAPPEFSTGFWMTPYNTKYWKRNNEMAGMGQYMISGQQSFPNRERQKAEEAYLASMSAVIKDQKNTKQNDLFTEAKKNFFQWMIGKKKLDILYEDIKILDFMIKSAEIRYKNGSGKIGAYYKAKAAIGSINNLILLSKNGINQNRIALNTLMHRPSNTPFDIDTLKEMKVDKVIDFDTATIINNRSDLKAIADEINVSNLEQNLVKSKLKPEYGIRYDHMFGFGGLPMQYTLMGMVKIPFANWSAKSYKTSIQSLKYKVIAKEQEKSALINESIGMAFSLKSQIETKQEQIKLYEAEIIPALKRNYQTSVLAYEQNNEDLFVLYDSWEKLNLIQLEYFDLIQQLFSSRIELERIVQTM